MTTGKVLKERRAPRERGRMGSGLTTAAACFFRASCLARDARSFSLFFASGTPAYICSIGTGQSPRLHVFGAVSNVSGGSGDSVRISDVGVELKGRRVSRS